MFLNEDLNRGNRKMKEWRFFLGCRRKFSDLRWEAFKATTKESIVIFFFGDCFQRKKEELRFSWILEVDDSGEWVIVAKTVQVCFLLLSVFSLILDSSFWSLLNVQFFLFGVDVKGHKLSYWDWLLTCLPYFVFYSFICRWCLLK